MNPETVAPQAPQKSKKGLVIAIVVIVVAVVAWLVLGSSSEAPVASDEASTADASVETVLAE